MVWRCPAATLLLARTTAFSDRLIMEGRGYVQDSKMIGWENLLFQIRLLLLELITGFIYRGIVVKVGPGVTPHIWAILSIPLQYLVQTSSWELRELAFFVGQMMVRCM